MTSKRNIYLDSHSTTPCDPRVFEAMRPYFTEICGNPASRDHRFGREAEAAVETARAAIASLIKADPREIIFTSGTTESNNLAIKGLARQYAEKGNHIVSAVTEHKSVLESLRRLEQEGFEVTLVPVDGNGLVDPREIERAITPKTILISIMAANNEVGTIAPIAEIGRIARNKGVCFHTDAAQAFGKIPLDVEAMKIDLMSFSAHKVYGPKGIGALYVRRERPRVRLLPIVDGGGHEQGLRSGTLNVPAIVGFGRAAEIAAQEMGAEGQRVAALRDRLYQRIAASLDEVYLNGHPTLRLPGNLNLSFAYVEGEALLQELTDEIAVSSGSACASASLEPSYVLQALGVGPERLHTAIRFGVGRFNTEEEIDFAARRVVEAVKKIREKSPLKAMAKARL